MTIPDFHSDSGRARLDEKSARRIAAGRLSALRQRIDAAILGPKGKSSKPDVRARAIQETLRAAFGEWFLASGRTGRTLVHHVALPGGKLGWIDLVVFRHHLRSFTTDVTVLAQLSAHATARLLERRRGVDIERLLARRRSAYGARYSAERCASRLTISGLSHPPNSCRVKSGVSFCTCQLAQACLKSWHDPRTGLVLPGRFIPILEETGLIYEVGRRVPPGDE